MPYLRRTTLCCAELLQAYKVLYRNLRYGTERLIGLGVRSMQFHINVWKGEDGYLIGKCVELPAAMTQGKTQQEVVENMREAILLVRQDIQAEAREKKAQQLTVEA